MLFELLALARGDGADAGALLLGCGLRRQCASASQGIGPRDGGRLLARCWPSTFGPLAAVADALDAHTTAVGLLIVALFAAALWLWAFARPAAPILFAQSEDDLHAAKPMFVLSHRRCGGGRRRDLDAFGGAERKRGCRRRSARRINRMPPSISFDVGA